MEKDSKVYIAGHTGMVGSAFHRKLIEQGYTNFVFRTVDELDLTRQKDVEDFFAQESPEYVILAAAKVGGIMANNTYRAQFIYENLMIQNNIIHNAYAFGVKKLLFLGSSCIYPKNAPQPLKEEYLLTGELEYTNEPYAIAKIAGIKMCESYNLQYDTNFISVMPTNLYGPNDNYNLETSHVLPALIRKIHLGKCLEKNDWQSLRKDLHNLPIEGTDGNSSDEEILDILAKYGITIDKSVTRHASRATVTLWGTGQVYREFLHVNDMASACVKIIEDIDISNLLIRSSQPETLNVKPGTSSHTTSHFTFFNIGSGIDQTIQELALLIQKIVGFKGKIIFDHTHADGTYKKLLDISRLKVLGFTPFYTLEQGIEQVYRKYAGVTL